MKIKSILINLSLLFISLIVGFFIIEGLFRIFSSEVELQKNKGIAVSDERGFTIWQKNYDGEFFSNEIDQNIHIVTNAEGFIGPNYSIEKPDETLRIALIGDSFVENFQIDYEKSYPYLLGKRLNEEVEQSVEVMNFGVGGQGTWEELNRYEFYVKQYQPDVVMLFFYANDFENNQYYLENRELIVKKDDAWKNVTQTDANFKQDRTDFKYKLLKTFRSIQKIDKLVRSNPALSKLAIQLGLHDTGVLGTAQEGIRSGFFIFQDPLKENFTEVYDFTAELITFFQEQVEQNNTKFVLVYLPKAEQVEQQMWENLREEIPALNNFNWDLNRPNSWLAKLAKIEGFDYLDMTEVIRGLYQDNPQNYLYNKRGKYHNGHFNAEGHQQTTAILSEYLIELLDLKNDI